MPRHGIIGSQTAYKRGLILGLTMAEIVLLLFFSVLLALAGLLWENEQTLQENQKTLQEKERILQEAFDERDAYRQEREDSQAKLEAVMKQLAQDDFQELKKELVRLSERERQIEYLMQRFSDITDKSAKEKISTLVEKLTKFEKVEEVLNVAGFSSEPDSLEKELQETKDSKEIINNLKNQLDSIKQELEQKKDELHNIKQKLDQKQGQVANMQRTLERYGQGTEKPACWADTKTGKPRYIYDIGLTSDGLIVRHSATPSWAKSRGLPIDEIPYGREMKLQEFIAAARPIFKWSEKNECRFFVRAYDLTAGHQKAIYKKHMRGLESFFYKYEVLDDPWKS